jgi:hypothetical protein
MGIFTTKDEEGNVYGRLTGRQVSPLKNERGGRTNDYSISGREDRQRKEADRSGDEAAKKTKGGG